MENKIKYIITSIGGCVSAFVNNYLGGWGGYTITLLIIMLIDYITGVFVALVFKNSPKTESGSYTSKAGYKGIIKKCSMLLMVLLGVRLDITLNVNYFQIGVTVAIILNELYSIKENLELMEIKIPFVDKIIEYIKNLGDNKK